MSPADKTVLSEPPSPPLFAFRHVRGRFLFFFSFPFTNERFPSRLNYRLFVVACASSLPDPPHPFLFPNTIGIFFLSRVSWSGGTKILRFLPHCSRCVLPLTPSKNVVGFLFILGPFILVAWDISLSFRSRTPFATRFIL